MRCRNTHHQRFGFLHMLGQDQRAERGRHGEGRDQAAGQRVGIGLRHRAEDVPLDAAQREQRNEAGDDDAGREKDRSIDVGRGVENRQPLAVQPGRRQRPDRLFRRLPVSVAAQPAEYAFHHDDRRIDDQAEIDGADRKKIGRFAADHQDADGKEQRERDGHADDDGAAQIAEEHPLQEEDQRDADTILCSTVEVVMSIRSLRS